MKSLRLILLTLILFLTLYCGVSSCQEADSYSSKTAQTDTLRTVAKALSSGVRYMELYEFQLQTTRYYDSMYNACINQPAKTIQVIETKPNWLVTGIVTVLTLLANWTIYLVVTK